jgi:hypothetical protein
MSCPEPEQIDAAPPPSGFTTPTKAIRNDGAAPAESNAEGTDAESDADVEKQFDESTGKMHKKRKFAPPHEYRVID